MTFEEILEQNKEIYGIPDDRLYSIDDILYNIQKFALLYLSSQKSSVGDAILNINIAFAWLLALINRYHIDVEEIMWHRYAYKCPFCLEIPCDCASNKDQTSKKTGRPPSGKPKNISEWQIMYKKIYNSDKEEDLKSKYIDDMQHLFDLIRLFMREKRKSQFKQLEIELVDFLVSYIRLLNTYMKDVTICFEEMFDNGCYVCHHIPCECNYFE